MSTPTITPFLLEPFRSAKRQLYFVGTAAALAIASLGIWPRLLSGLLSTDFLPHLYCYLKNPALVWTHVVADLLIAIAYFSISLTLGYLVYKGWRDLPFQGLLTAFGLFILASWLHPSDGGDHGVGASLRSYCRRKNPHRDRFRYNCDRPAFHCSPKRSRSCNRQRFRDKLLPSYAPAKSEKTLCSRKSTTA